jgi:hypothetical protein
MLWVEVEAMGVAMASRLVAAALGRGRHAAGHPMPCAFFAQAATAAGMAHCANVFCQAGSARSVPYQRLISP